MLTVISPSKTLDFSACDMSFHTTPIFTKEMEELVTTMKTKSVKEIIELMDISEKLAELNYARYQKFELQASKQAILSFKGDVYQAIEIEKYRDADFSFAQENLRILSGLYGLLRPLDLIQPYRLEMGLAVIPSPELISTSSSSAISGAHVPRTTLTPLDACSPSGQSNSGNGIKTKTSNNLYDFWKDKITAQINLELLEKKYLINLASSEYFTAIDSKKLSGKLINITFKEKRDEQYKIIGIFAKKARGMMVNYIIRNKINHPDALKEFNQAGYKFMRNFSTAQDFIFVRESNANI